MLLKLPYLDKVPINFAMDKDLKEYIETFREVSTKTVQKLHDARYLALVTESSRGEPSFLSTKKLLNMTSRLRVWADLAAPIDLVEEHEISCTHEEAKELEWWDKLVMSVCNRDNASHSSADKGLLSDLRFTSPVQTDEETLGSRKRDSAMLFDPMLSATAFSISNRPRQMGERLPWIPSSKQIIVSSQSAPKANRHPRQLTNERQLLKHSGKDLPCLQSMKEEGRNTTCISYGPRK